MTETIGKRQEIQIKTRKSFSPEELIALGAEWIGNCESENFYLGSSNGTTRRIRVEGSVYHYTEKSSDRGEFARVKDITETEFSANEAKALMKECGVIEKIDISSRMFLLNGYLISLDEVTGLGKFIEISAVASEEDLKKAIQFLKIDCKDCIKESYFDLMQSNKMPKWRKAVVRTHKKIAEMTYGLTSGIMTTSGMLTGVYFAMSTKRAVAGCMIAIAVSDSFSEAYSMYNARLMEGMSHRNAKKTCYLHSNRKFSNSHCFLDSNISSAT